MTDLELSKDDIKRLKTPISDSDPNKYKFCRICLSITSHCFINVKTCEHNFCFKEKIRKLVPAIILHENPLYNNLCITCCLEIIKYDLFRRRARYCSSKLKVKYGEDLKTSPASLYDIYQIRQGIKKDLTLEYINIIEEAIKNQDSCMLTQIKILKKDVEIRSRTAKRDAVKNEDESDNVPIKKIKLEPIDEEQFTNTEEEEEEENVCDLTVKLKREIIAEAALLKAKKEMKVEKQTAPATNSQNLPKETQGVTKKPKTPKKIKKSEEINMNTVKREPNKNTKLKAVDKSTTTDLKGKSKKKDIKTPNKSLKQKFDKNKAKTETKVVKHKLTAKNSDNLTSTNYLVDNLLKHLTEIEVRPFIENTEEASNIVYSTKNLTIIACNNSSSIPPANLELPPSSNILNNENADAMSDTSTSSHDIYTPDNMVEGEENDSDSSLNIQKMEKAAKLSVRKMSLASTSYSSDISQTSSSIKSSNDKLNQSLSETQLIPLGNVNVYTCPCCHVVFYTRKAFATHKEICCKKTRSQINIKSCPFCNKIMKSLKPFIRHKEHCEARYTKECINKKATINLNRIDDDLNITSKYKLAFEEYFEEYNIKKNKVVYTIKPITDESEVKEEDELNESDDNPHTPTNIQENILNDSIQIKEDVIEFEPVENYITDTNLIKIEDDENDVIEMGSSIINNTPNTITQPIIKADSSHTVVVPNHENYLNEQDFIDKTFTKYGIKRSKDLHASLQSIPLNFSVKNNTITIQNGAKLLEETCVLPVVTESNINTKISLMNYNSNEPPKKMFDWGHLPVQNLPS